MLGAIEATGDPATDATGLTAAPPTGAIDPIVIAATAMTAVARGAPRATGPIAAPAPTAGLASRPRLNCRSGRGPSAFGPAAPTATPC